MRKRTKTEIVCSNVLTGFWYIIAVGCFVLLLYIVGKTFGIDTTY